MQNTGTETETAANRAVAQACSLDGVDRLFLWVGRSLAFGTQDHDLLGAQLSRRLGSVGPVVLAYHFAFLRCLCTEIRPRRLSMHMPDCPCVSGDEQDLVAIMGAARSDTPTMVAARLSHILKQPPSPGLTQAAAQLGLLYADPVSDDRCGTSDHTISL